MKTQLTPEEAIALGKTNFWENLSHREIANFQLFQECLCMPFSVFHEALEKSLGRSVWTHEMGMNWEGLKHEFLGETPAPSFADIVNLIPEDKRVLVTTP